MKYDVFISYSRKDIAVADRICSVFDKVGINYFIDRVGISGGFEFPAVLADAIIESRIFLYLASNNSYESKFTQSEITFAFNEKPKGSILPYIIDGSIMPPALRFVFSSINWRRLDEHPIDTVLVDDLLRMLGKKRSESPGKISQEDAVKCSRRGDDAYDKKDYEEAVKWYRKAAEQGHAAAQYNLGVCYRNGIGISTDESEAVKWYRKAAEQGHAAAQYKLGVCYRNGRGVPTDESEAVKWYRNAAEQGHARAQFNLGWCYRNGRGIPTDESEAVKWYRKAAEQGHAAAQFDLGWCYENGRGVSKDESEAVKWYRKAAEQGDDSAIKALESLKSNFFSSIKKLFS